MQVTENVNNKLVLKYGFTINVKSMSYNKCSESNIHDIKFKILTVFKIMS